MSTESYDGYSHIQRLNSDSSEEELVNVYSAWSNNYDKDVHHLAYTGPVVAANQLTQKLRDLGYNEDASILDLGCGTGLVGEQLHKRGYKNVDGLDLTADLLEVAGKKGVYRSLRQGRMASEDCKDLGVAADQYDAVVCIGVFIAGHVNSKGLDDMVRVAKPGGLASFSVRENAPQEEFHDKMNELSQKGKWKLISKSFEQHYIKKGRAWFYVYQIL